MYAVNFTDSAIIPLNGVNDYEFKSYAQYDNFKEAKLSLLSYWENARDDAIGEIKKIKKMKDVL
ncbi:hypothetical protein N8Z08_02085 [bacterium]|nr:hypothetical protein [bacterium]